jgi:hypothetical protein
MNGYLSAIASRAVERPQPLRPRVASLFEPIITPTIPVLERSKKSARPRVTPPASADVSEQAIPAAARELSHSMINSSAISPAPAVESSSHSFGRIEPHETKPSQVAPSESNREPVPDREASNKRRGPDERFIVAAQAPPQRDERALPSPRATSPPLESTVVSERNLATLAVPAGEPKPRSETPSELRSAQVVIRPEVKASHEPPAPVQVGTEAAEIMHHAAPAIRITIGRVDVRAIMPQQQTAPQPQSSRQNSALTLDDYLKKRNGALT